MSPRERLDLVRLVEIGPYVDHDAEPLGGRPEGVNSRVVEHAALRGIAPQPADVRTHARDAPAPSGSPGRPGRACKRRPERRCAVSMYQREIDCPSCKTWLSESPSPARLGSSASRPEGVGPFPCRPGDGRASPSRDRPFHPHCRHERGNQSRAAAGRVGHGGPTRLAREARRGNRGIDADRRSALVISRSDSMVWSLRSVADGVRRIANALVIAWIEEYCRRAVGLKQ